MTARMSWLQNTFENLFKTVVTHSRTSWIVGEFMNNSIYDFRDSCMSAIHEDLGSFVDGVAHLWMYEWIIHDCCDSCMSDIYECRDSFMIVVSRFSHEWAQDFALVRLGLHVCAPNRSSCVSYGNNLGSLSGATLSYGYDNRGGMNFMGPLSYGYDNQGRMSGTAPPETVELKGLSHGTVEVWVHQYSSNQVDNFSATVDVFCSRCVDNNDIVTVGRVTSVTQPAGISSQLQTQWWKVGWFTAPAPGDERVKWTTCAFDCYQYDNNQYGQYDNNQYGDRPRDSDYGIYIHIYTYI